MTLDIPHDFVLLDTETTGLPHHPKAHVIELGAVLVTGGAVGAAYQSFVRPPTYDPVEAEPARRIHGLGPEHFYHAPAPAEVQQTFFEWRVVNGAHGWPLFAWIGHFDDAMLRRSGFVDLDVFDIRGPARKRLPVEVGKGPLGAVAIRLGIALAERHRALDDARLAALVWLAVRDQVPRG